MSEFEELSLIKLRDLCKSLGLKTSGKKSILVSRILKFREETSEETLSLVAQVPDANEFLNTEIHESLSLIQSNWFGKSVLVDQQVDLQTLGLAESCETCTIHGSIRFWMSRFYNLIEYRYDEWADYEINSVSALSKDFIVVEETSLKSKRLHLVLKETGQVVESALCTDHNALVNTDHNALVNTDLSQEISRIDSLFESESELSEISDWGINASNSVKSNSINTSKLQEWSLWTAQFKNTSLISRVETVDSSYPHNISKRIKDSKEYGIAVRFTLLHVFGLHGGSESLVQMKKTGGPIKCLISVPLDNAVVSVHLSHLGIPFVFFKK
jgi:hypothetical protein